MSRLWEYGATKLPTRGMPTDLEYKIATVNSLDDVSETAWQAFAGSNPFVSYRFLRLLQESGCAVPRTGWHPQFLLLYRAHELVAAAPCYLKTHSRGEFVFDQSWAQAFAEHGLRYYPKLLIASPFTPVQGPRLLAKDSEARFALAQAVGRICEATEASSAHVLFVEEQDKDALLAAGFMMREGVQFHWRNEDYVSTDDFLAKMSHDKRKKIRQDSRYVAEAGITYRWLEGDDLDEQHIEFFYTCYSNTYREHWSTPYLSADFFKQAHHQAALRMVLVVGYRDGQPVACALNVRSDDVLYGRYWGTTEFAKGLHFETCYMQSIAYCIANGLRAFEGGAQGEHKMSRGLIPTKTQSAHWVRDQRFSRAILDFLQRESEAIDTYVTELELTSPFKGERATTGAARS